MLLNKANFEVAHLCDEDDRRFTLGGILIEPGATVATNGHYLVKVTTPTYPAEDYPTGKLGIEATEDELKPCILPKAAAKAVLKTLPKRQPVPVLNHAYLDVKHTNANGAIRFAMTDLETTQFPEFRKIDGEFPDYRQVIPSDEDVYATVGLNVDYLEKICRVIKRCDVSKTKRGIRLELMGRRKDEGDDAGQLVHDDCCPVRISATNEEGQEITVVLMPMRL